MTDGGVAGTERFRLDPEHTAFRHGIEGESLAELTRTLAEPLLEQLEALRVLHTESAATSPRAIRELAGLVPQLRRTVDEVVKVRSACDALIAANVRPNPAMMWDGCVHAGARVAAATIPWAPMTDATLGGRGGFLAMTTIAMTGGFSIGFALGSRSRWIRRLLELTSRGDTILTGFLWIGAAMAFVFSAPVAIGASLAMLASLSAGVRLATAIAAEVDTGRLDELESALGGLIRTVEEVERLASEPTGAIGSTSTLQRQIADVERHLADLQHRLRHAHQFGVLLARRLR